MDKIISEESSEKKKRGRPREYPEKMIREILSSGSVKTERGAREHLLMCVTFHDIKDAWNADPSKNVWAKYYFGEAVVLHQSIMAVLGRIRNEKERLDIARIIAEKKMSTRSAVALLRRILADREDKPDCQGLEKSLRTCLKTYLAIHPTTTLEMMIDQLRELADSIEADSRKAKVEEKVSNRC